MKKTAFKIYACFVLSAAGIAVILLIINFFALAVVATDTENIYENSPRRELNMISDSLTVDDSGKVSADASLVSPDCWCIFIDESGEVVWSCNMPEDIPTHYTVMDIASMTRWFLNDYPVYVNTEDHGLLVLGYPKNSVGKYSTEYSMQWFSDLPWRLLTVLLINAALAAIIAFIIGTGLYRQLRLMVKGIINLKEEKPVKLKERGIFGEIARNLNNTSAAIERKNNLLKKRDNARSEWVSCISHDIRTPLSVILGNAEAMSENDALNEEERKRADIIKRQSIKIKKLVEDLNLMSSLEYDMQPFRKKKIRLCSLIRRTVSDIINAGLDDKYSVEFISECEEAFVLGDESLLERAFFNIISNSISHNKEGCSIVIKAHTNKSGNMVEINIWDNGSGVDQDVLENIEKIPKTKHGLGLPMAYKIINAHGGSLHAENNNGFRVYITLPSDI